MRLHWCAARRLRDKLRRRYRQGTAGLPAILAHAAKPILSGLHGHKRTVLLCSRLQFLPGAGTIPRHHELVIACEHKLDRSFGLFGEFAREHAFNADSKFRAKAAAHVLHRRGNRALRQTQSFSGIPGIVKVPWVVA